MYFNLVVFHYEPNLFPTSISDIILGLLALKKFNVFQFLQI